MCFSVTTTVYLSLAVMFFTLWYEAESENFGKR